ncbi:MAG: hypothetical protein PVS2B2_18940 [Candidatus Acidiferrum sp.]
MNITVILCTYNRAGSLPVALESVAGSLVSQTIGWEVLVVDNNSRDQTREVVDEFRKRYPGRFRYLFESKPGKSNALNSGIREAHGDILAFMDDDVTVEPTWLQNLTAPLYDGEWTGSGGRIVPEGSFSRPAWLFLDGPEGRYALAPLALFDLGSKAGKLEESPFGTNMAFRKEVFERYGGFRTDLGPCPGSEIRSEDTEFGGRLLAAGEQLYYQPSAIVHHQVSEFRLRKKYFETWWFDKGRANVRVLGVSKASICCGGIPLYLVRRLLHWTIRWIVEIDPGRRFIYKLKVCVKLGEIKECKRLSLDTKIQRRECDVRS